MLVNEDPWLRIELDAELLFRRVTVSRVDVADRGGEALVQAFDEAWSDAISVVVDQDAGSSAQGHPAPGAPVGPRTRRLPSYAERPVHHPTYHRFDEPEAPERPLHPTGRSDNECLTVRLDAASSRARVHDVDASWLRQTTPTRLEAAIDQSVRAAYDQGDLR